MRRAAVLALWGLGAAALARGEGAADQTPQRLTRYFQEWFSVCPANRVTVKPAAEIALSGYEAYRVERHCGLKNREEQTVAIVDPAKDEVFVGQILHSDERHDQPFAAETDLPVLARALQEVFGVPTSIRVETGTRGPLIPIVVGIRQAENASATLPGFVSQDGASLLLGEFLPLGERPNALRERLIAEASGPRSKAAFAVDAFIDFQCERCRVRTPKIRDFAWSHGGALEVHFLPLVKVHEWAFPAAENAAALASVSPALYARYEETLFARAASMNAKAAADLAADVAEAAGARPAFDAEIQSGRARQRVLRDIELALRLGLNSTPVFFFRGAQLSSEPDLAEGYVAEKLGLHETSGKKGSSR